MANPAPHTLVFRRPRAAANAEAPAIFPPAIFTTATYTRGILVPNEPTVAVDASNNALEEVTINIPNDYFRNDGNNRDRSLPMLSSEEANYWNHSIAAHAAARRRSPMEVGRFLGTITLDFEESTGTKSSKKKQSLFYSSRKYGWSGERRKPSVKESGKHKAPSAKQAFGEACLERGLDENVNPSALSPDIQRELERRSQQIFEHWKRVRDSKPLLECWHKKDGGFMSQSLGDVQNTPDNEFYVPIPCLLEWLNSGDVADLAAGRVKSLYNGLRQIDTNATTILESLIDLSCPASLYKIPLITSYAVARRIAQSNNESQWKVRIGVYMNRLLPEVLTEKNLHCVMSALDDDSYIVSEPLHLPPMRDLHDPVFESSKYPIVKMAGTKYNDDDSDVEDEMSVDEEKKEDEDEVPADPAMFGSSRDTKTISPFTPRGLLKLLENTGNVTSMFPEIARSFAPYLKLDLMLHQQHAVCWMTQMEHLPGFGINSIIWEEREFFDGNKYYYSPALGQIRLNRPPVTVGGCVADEMGLGKTIQMLSLIVSSLAELKREASEGGTNCTHATLIVVPPALVMQWVSEVRKCCGESLTVNVLDANSSEIRGLVEDRGNGTDILVTTYSALEQPKTSRYLAGWSWGRIVLDEQQEIRSSTTKIAMNCESLICHRRWMLSGTPIFEGIGDLRGELNFLRLTPYAAKWEDGFFDFSIMNHWNHRSEHGIETLRILGLLLLRRSKDMTVCETGASIMEQKKLTIELVPVAQSESERALYCWFEYIVSQEIQRRDSKSSVKSNLQSRDLCLRLLREICFSAVLINGGLGVPSQMKDLNAMYRRLLSRAEQEVTTQIQKRAGAIRVMSPLKALTYLSQAERAANVGEEFVSDQQFGGGQGASSRTYATDSIEVQVERAQQQVDEATRKEFDARQKRAKAHWHLALELLTTGYLSNDDELLSSASSKVTSLWKFRGTCRDDEIRGWRPSSSFVKKIHRFPWSRPNTLQLANIPSQVSVSDISSALLDALKKEPNARSKLEGLRKRLSQTKKAADKPRIESEISNAQLLLDQAISDDRRLQPPTITAIDSTSGSENSWVAYVEATTEEVREQIIKQARSRAGIVLRSKEVVPHIQAALNEATENFRQAEAAYSVYPCAKNKEDKVAAQKVVDNARLGLCITFDSAVLPSSTNVIMYHALRSRGTAPRTRSALLDGIYNALAQASGSLGRARASLQDGQSTLTRLMRSLERGNLSNVLTQQKSAFDTLEALRLRKFEETFCPICQLPFGENKEEDPGVQEKIVAMISCGHFFCIHCLDQHVQTEIGRNRPLACPCCRKTFSQTNDVIHIDHLTSDDEEVTTKRAEAKMKVREASEMLATSEGVLDGELWHQLFLSIDLPVHVSNAPHRIHTALPQDALAHFRAATGMKIDCSRTDAPESWVGRELEGSNYSGLSSKVQALLKDLPIGEHSVVFCSSKEGVLHLATVIKANGIDCFSLFTGQNTKATEEAVSSWSFMVLDATKTGPVLVLQAGAAASGLTLTAASKLFLMEPFSRQEEEMQAYARCHRFGQKRDVYVKIYYTPVSVESRLLKWRRRSTEKIAALTNKNTNYVFFRLYGDEDIEDDGYDDADIHRVSMSGDEKEGEECHEGETADEEEQSAEAGEENLRTQFLLGLVNEDGNPRNEDIDADDYVAIDRSVSARRFILN